jgi:4-alpha-glucanotransferase
MNVPGRASGNWSWRFSDDMLSPASFESLRALTESCKRSVGPQYQSRQIPA